VPKYDRLTDYLVGIRGRGGEAKVTFAQIDSLVGSLPAAARSNASWWTDKTKAQTRSWSAAGWQVRSVDLEAEHVVFTRPRTADRGLVRVGSEQVAGQRPLHRSWRQPWKGWSERHPVVLALWIAIISSLIVSGIVGVIHLVSGSGQAAAAVTAAERVASCVSGHHMTSAAEGPLTPSPGMNAPFASANQGRFSSSDPIYGSGTIPVTLYESCSWPTASGSDVTGYAQVLVSTVPGSAKWPGLVNPYTYADVADSSCQNLTFFYRSGHTLSSGSVAVDVPAGSLRVIDPTANRGPAPGPHGKMPTTIAGWAQTVGYYYVPRIGEAVVLREGDLHLLKVGCGS